MLISFKSLISEKELEQRTDLALDWLKHSFEVTQEKGSAAYYRKLPWSKGSWAAAYPETTGYIINTLLDYHAIKRDSSLYTTALKATQWLMSLQKKDGSFPGGFSDGPLKPSVFNSAMILFGLIKAYEVSRESDIIYSAARVVEWLLDILEADGSWKKAAFVEGYSPAYYSKVIWSIMEANKTLQLSAADEKMNKALNYYSKLITSDLFIENCGFHKKQTPLTHTLAYSLTGFIHSSILLKNQEVFDKAFSVCVKLAEVIADKGKAAATYNCKWKGDYSYQCLTGNAQLSILFLQLKEQANKDNFERVIPILVRPLLKAQRLSGTINVKGAIPGSWPYWGPYFRFSYPNWGVKFFLDLCSMLKEE